MRERKEVEGEAKGKSNRWGCSGPLTGQRSRRYTSPGSPCSVSSLGEFQLALASRQILHMCIPLVLRLEEGMKRHGAVLRVGCRCWSLGTVRDSKVLIGVYC